MYDLKLSIAPSAWRLFTARNTDAGFAPFKQKVLERDNYNCQYCGFQAKQYQQVVNLDQDYHNNKLLNMVTACCFCMQCMFIESVGQSDYGSGILIYLPEISQTDLNGLCHVLFCAIANATNYKNEAQNIYRNLKLRSKFVQEQLGEGMSNPALLGKMMLNSPLDNREQLTDKILKDLRLLPSRTHFSEQIEAWAQAALEELSN